MTPTAPILFTIPNFITAGSGRAMLNIIERLDRQRFAPAVCVQEKGGTLDRVVDGLGIPFLEAPFTVRTRPYASLPARTWRAAQAFKPYRFALWHSFNYKADYTEPLIARLAGARAWVYTKKNMRWYPRQHYLRTLLATRVAVQNTDMMRDFFAVWQRKARFVPRGVATDRFHPGVPSRLALRQRYGLADKTTLVGCVADLVPVKGHPTLLEATASLPRIHLFLAGKSLDAAYVASLHQLAAELNLTSRITFLSHVDDVPAFLAEIDVFVLPTWGRGEGCPVSLLEAMASSRAAVATDVPGSRDLITSGQSGLLVPAEDAAALSDALNRLAGDPGLRCRLGQAARARVEKHYTIEREVADHEALYAEVLFG